MASSASVKSALSNPKTVVTLVSQLFVVRSVISRVNDARESGHKIELVDALVNAVALVTGTIVIVQRLRRGEDDA